MTFRPGGDGMMFHNFLRQLLNDGMRDSVPPGQEIPHINTIGYVEKYVNTYAYIYIIYNYIYIYTVTYMSGQSLA